MARTARLVAATTLLVLAAPAYAAHPLEGRYELRGELRGGGKYRGEAEIRVEDGEYVLTTRIEGGGARPIVRASRTPDREGTYRFRYGGPTRGLAGRLGEATGEAAAGPERLLLVRAQAKITTRREFTNAHNLCEIYTRAVAGTGSSRSETAARC